MINIKQITNYDLINVTAIVQKNIRIGGGVFTRTWDYKIISEDLMGGKPFKLGYCCEDFSKDYPIFLTINGEEREFQLGKTGMFEYQPETIEEDTTEILVSEIKVPVDVYFTLDYCIEV